MLKHHLRVFGALLVVTLGSTSAAQPVSAPEYGPSRGALVIAGGGTLEGTGILERFIELAGGADKTFIIVPTAGGNRNRDGAVTPYDEEAIVRSWVRRGLKNVKMLHTHDPKVADTEAFVKDLREADGVWFNGGRQCWDDLIPVIRKLPALLGLGLSESTAIVVTGDRLEVIGTWKVAVHDNTRQYQPWEKPYFVLSPGDVYDMKSRKVEKYGMGAAPRRSAQGVR